MRDRPSLTDLRARVFKHSGTDRPEVGNWLARRVGRPSAVYGTWLAARLGLGAHAITTMALVASLCGAVGIGSGSRGGFEAGVLALYLAYWLDHVDGQVARWRRSASLAGVYFDYLLHHVANLALGFALGFGLAMRSDSPPWALAGFAISGGWTLLSLHNDCRYKAFFQRLKQPGKSYRVDGGSASRPSPPSPWPRCWPGLVSWPAAKACEPHGVLFAITILMIAAAVAPRLWVIGWRGYVVAMATVAPGLAIARCTKTIAKGEADAEFDGWFRPS